MTTRPTPLAACAAALLALLPAHQASAQTRSPFDGVWIVVLTCTGAYDGAAGYTFRFQAAVQNGTLHGEYGVQGQPGSLSIDGPIASDGKAMFVAQGLTNNPVYSVGRVPRPGHTPITCNPPSRPTTAPAPASNCAPATRCSASNNSSPPAPRAKPCTTNAGPDPPPPSHPRPAC